MTGKVVALVKKRKWVFIISASVIAALLITVGALASIFMPTEGKIARGVRVNGVDIGNMSIKEARELIDKSGFYNDDFTISSENESVTVEPQEVQLEVDEGKTALKAYEIGHSGNFLKRLNESFRLLTVGIDITPSMTLESIDRLDAILYELGVKINGRGSGVTVEDISDTQICVYPPVAGQDINVTEARDIVLEELAKSNGSVRINVILKKKATQLTTDELFDFLTIEGQNAGYEVKDNELIIFDEMKGRKVDKAEVDQKLSQFNSGEPITLAVEWVMPEITAESLRADLFSTELASYKSSYSTSAANRAFNVARAAASCNGIILLPNQIFSYNEAIGNPSLANGYKIASVYENGRQTEGVGGGVCQVSSTIYSAALYANLEIVERRSHSLTVGYVPKGQDATVSYGVLDFKFKNSTDKPIKLVVTASGGVCRVQILGSKPDVERKVELSHSVVSTTSPSENVKYDETLPEGTKKVTSKGKTGYVVDSVRRVFENGTEVKTEKLTRSTYKMVANEVTVGTMAKPTPTPSATPVPTDIPVSKPIEEAPEPTSAPTESPIAIPEQTPNATDIIEE